MKTLYLLRHAKSDWSDGALSDHARPLNPRGKAAAPLMARYLTKKRYKPSLILCSTARRTVETFDLIRPSLLPDVTVRYEDALYLAEWRRLLERVRWIDEPCAAAMIVGHNPGMEQLAQALAGAGQSAAETSRREAMSQKYPTAALAVLKFDVDAWKKIAERTGRLVDFTCPKDLDGVESD